MDKDIEFYKKRLENSQKENEMLKKENKVINTELVSLKKLVTGLVDLKQDKMSKSTLLDPQTEQELRLILEFQSKRIKTLENELNIVQTKYERNLFSTEDVSNGIRPYSAMYSSQFPEMQRFKLEAKEKQEDMDKYLKNASREIGSLKSRIAKQDAEILLSQSQIMDPNSMVKNALKSTQNLKQIQSRQQLDALKTITEEQKNQSLQIGGGNFSVKVDTEQQKQKFNTVKPPSSQKNNRKSVSQFENKFGHLYEKSGVLGNSYSSSNNTSFQTPQLKQNATKLLDSLETASQSVNNANFKNYGGNSDYNNQLYSKYQKK